MGVPAFFRWLSRKYPSILVYCIQEKSAVVNEVEVPIDTSKPNPNEIEFDNLYLDMNGIIHPCCHPEDGSQPTTIDDMITAVFAYIDCIFSIVRPRKLVYFAIDGVAPRAKMNQQRSRRFRSSKESIDKKDKMSEVRQKLQDQGIQLPPRNSAQDPFDSNCITPGTDFMHYLSRCLQFYIAKRLNEDAGWQGLEAILSDANAPGEGEHKIMDFIRKQRASQGYNPNTRHVLYGADADLIMLGLATHEPHFTIIREEFTPNKPRPCEICGQLGHTFENCEGKANEDEDIEAPSASFSLSKQFVFIKLYVLREYLEQELTFDKIGSLVFDFERALDDWVFMCFFVGNDFLPHLPSLEIREEAVDRLIRIYKESLQETQGYITYQGQVDLEKVGVILEKLGRLEDSIFKKRREGELSRKNQARNRNFRRDYNQKRHHWENEPINRHFNESQPPDTYSGRHHPRAPRGNPRALRFINARKDDDNFSAAKDLQQSLTPAPHPHPSYSNYHPQQQYNPQQYNQQQYNPQQYNPQQYNAPSGSTMLYKVDLSSRLGNRYQQGRGQQQQQNEDEEEEEDRVRLWEEGWRERYYNEKFCITSCDQDFISRIVYFYTQGLCWVFAYYYQGCANWKWYYPFHYAPFASDFGDVMHIPNVFETGTQPFNPLEQLMGVFPAASRKFLPVSWQRLMIDPVSPIVDFYPTDFEIDLNRKKFAWQGVGLLPFVDESRLLEALKSVYDDLTEEEKDRNCTSKDKFFLSHKHSGFKFICTIYENPSTAFVQLPPELFAGMSGLVKIDRAPFLPQLPIPSPLEQQESISDNQIINCFYDNPSFHEGTVFKSNLLEGAKFPASILTGERGAGRYGHKRSVSEDSPAKRMITNSLPQSKRGMSRINPFISFSSAGSNQQQPSAQDPRSIPTHNRWHPAPLFPPPPMMGPTQEAMKRRSSEPHEPAQQKPRPSFS